MSEGSDNVIIFGAGASATAGIPLLPNFVRKMWEMAERGTLENLPLSLENLTVLRTANEIRRELQNYQSRANFDSENIEDLLSILAFEQMGNRLRGTDYDSLVQAVALTIELCGRVPFCEQPKPLSQQSACVKFYADFWNSLFSHYSTRLPTIITFNYDLVLERALFHLCNNFDSPPRLPAQIELKYTPKKSLGLLLAPASLDIGPAKKIGTSARVGTGEKGKGWVLDYCKLHGSLNWPRNLEKAGELNLQAQPSPLILPPVFDKMGKGGDSIVPVWNTALKALRKAKNLVIVGYSLPRTDVYMQYFFRAAIGPNADLNRVFVFNPAFHGANVDGDLKGRYESCFSEHFRRKVDFYPPHVDCGHDDLGTFRHFLKVLDKPDEGLLF